MNFVDKAHIEKQFINTISFNLELFSWVSNASNTANCRCNICGDSKTKRNKRRLFFYEKDGSFLVHCHNCGYHRSFSNYLKEYFLEYYSKYISELFAHKKKQSLVVDYSLSNKPPLSLQPAVLNFLSNGETCKNTRFESYLLKRKIPVDKYNRIYYTTSTKLLASVNSEYYKPEHLGTEDRIVFPCFNEYKQFLGLTARIIDGYGRRYLHFKVKDLSEPFVYGCNTAVFGQRLFIVEGHIDSLCLDNSIAIGNSTLTSIFNKKNVITKNYVFACDFQPRNIEICKQMFNIIDKNLPIVILPDSYIEFGKDVNSLICNGISDISSVFDRYTYKGLSARLAFSKFKRV